MLEIISLPTTSLTVYAQNARIHGKRQVSQIARSIEQFGFNNPILIDESNTVIAGHGRLLAAKELGLKEVPTIMLDHLSEAQRKAFILADNKIAERAGWDQDLVRQELEALLSFDTDFDLTQTGFETPEIDIILNGTILVEKDPLDDLPNKAITKRVQAGELWQLGEHRLFCGDSLKEESFSALLGDKKADLIFTDPPYNVAIDGHVCGNGAIKHADFAYASGEMSESEFVDFLKRSLKHLADYSQDGSIHYVCIDWRHVGELLAAGKFAYSELKNICIWNKQTGGMGSLYRSQHEMIFVFKNGTASHTNNIELGKHGRYRTNIWDYAGVNSSGTRRSDLKLHPTVKPVQMVADAIVDCSPKGGLVLDCFGGSGSTLLAAEKTGRKAFLIEYEPAYCDVILHRFEKMTGKKAALVNGGKQ